MQFHKPVDTVNPARFFLINKKENLRMSKNIDPAVEATIRREWDSSPSIRKEFRDSFAGYSGFRQAQMNGRFKSTAASSGTAAFSKPEGLRRPDVSAADISESSGPAEETSPVLVSPARFVPESRGEFRHPLDRVAIKDRTPAQDLQWRKAYRAHRLAHMSPENREFFIRVLPPVK